MATDAMMKVMVLGNAMTLKRMVAALNNYNVNLVCLTQTPEAMNRLGEERFDVILVDSLLAEACDACHSMGKHATAPIGLLVRETEVNWQKLASWEVDGFIREESGRLELLARIKAISRRLTNNHNLN